MGQIHSRRLHPLAPGPAQNEPQQVCAERTDGQAEERQVYAEGVDGQAEEKESILQSTMIS